MGTPYAQEHIVLVVELPISITTMALCSTAKITLQKLSNVRFTVYKRKVCKQRIFADVVVCSIDRSSMVAIILIMIVRITISLVGSTSVRLA